MVLWLIMFLPFHAHIISISWTCDNSGHHRRLQFMLCRDGGWISIESSGPDILTVTRLELWYYTVFCVSFTRCLINDWPLAIQFFTMICCMFDSIQIHNLVAPHYAIHVQELESITTWQQNHCSNRDVLVCVMTSMRTATHFNSVLFRRGRWTCHMRSSRLVQITCSMYMLLYQHEYLMVKKFPTEFTAAAYICLASLNCTK